MSGKGAKKAESNSQLDDIVAMPGKYKATNPLVLSSLNSGMTIVLPEASSELQQRAERSRSVPTSPSQVKGIRKYFPSPASPRMKKKQGKSDPDVTVPHSHRPNWLNFRHKKKSRSADGINGGTTPVGEGMENLHMVDSGVSPLEATPMATLPGQKDRAWDGGEIPTIMVSNMEGEFDDQNPERKMSQSSHHSHCSTMLSGTSGVGSLLSPSSGDECDPGSDLESPLSPLSGASSFTDEAPGSISDCDPIEQDIGGLTSPCSDQESVDITPTGSRDSSPPEHNVEGATPSKEQKKKSRRHGRVRLGTDTQLLSIRQLIA